jgi:hypothetical protein
MARTKKADKLAMTHKRKQMWVFADKWVELHNKVEQLEQQVKYWQIEANCDNARWISALEELDKVRKQIQDKQK